MRTIDAVTVETLLAHAEFVRGLARGLVLDPATADDAMQQAWVEACARPPRDLRSPRGWLATVTQQAVRRIRRDEARRGARERAAAQPERIPSAADIAEREETRRKLVHAVLALVEPYRSAIVLRYMEELPPRGVAARLGVPVETARTRIKRGLAELRGALDRQFDGDRKAWALLLMPWALPAAKTGAKSLSVMAWAAASLALGAAAVWGVRAWRSAAGPERSEPLVSGPMAAPKGRGEAARQPPVRSPAGSGGASGRAEFQVAAQDAKPGVRIPGPASAAPGSGTLRLRAKLARAIVSPRDTVVLTATFENTGDGALQLFIPQHAGLVPFPSWRLVGLDGGVHVPETPAFQSMWQTGIQGTIRRLEPGGRWSVTVRASLFRRLAGNAYAGRDPVRLPEGQYRVRCSYTQQTNAVPFGEAMMKRRTQAVPGLWTGEVEADVLLLSVTAAPVPSLTARLVEEPIAGGAVSVELALRNPTPTSLSLGDLVVTMHAKGQSSGSAVVPREKIRPLAAAAELPRALSGSSELRVRVDLARLAFVSRRRGETCAAGLYELVPQGGMRFSVAWSLKELAEPLRSDTMWIRFRAGPARVEGLTLEVLPVGGSNVQVRLTNTGARTLRVRERLSWPSDVRVTLKSTDETRGVVRSVTMSGGLQIAFGVPDPAPLAKGLSWDGDRYERPGPLSADDFIELPQGGILTRVLRLADLVYGGLPAGSYEVRAIWRSLTDGRHLGLAPAVTGVLASKPVVVTVN